MDTRTVLELLGYSSSSNFLSEEKLDDEREHAHVFRRAADACKQQGGHFWGVYALREGDGNRAASTPVVYVADAPTDAAADALHRKVWNQSVVPFLLVCVDKRVRLYSGFEYVAPRGGSERHGVLEASIAVDATLSRLEDLHARSIDTGEVWRERIVDPRKRLDRKLLTNLKNLGAQLRRSQLASETAHGLIGKFVYLRYLRDRGILSDRRLEELGVDTRVFGRRTSLSSLQRLVGRVDDWLNGSVFPIPLSGKNAPTEEQVGLVASVFLGDEAETGQLHLDFRAYDFSYIPIETLSVIYEQFLAAEGKQSDAGAYYTPLAVVNFLLAEMDQVRSLKSGMRVLDPSCGSGAFLVQCYRRLIEDQMRELGRNLRATELRELLVRHVFGVDRDEDACRVAQLSLILTLLDYVDPPDLMGSRFKLPELSGSNIVHGDFFEPDAAWERAQKDGFDWIVGNPPWLQLDDDKEEDRPANRWIEEHSTTRPVVRQQVAEAFTWKAAEHCKPKGVVGLLIPAMSLVTETATFRDAFLRTHRILAVANFTNLRRMLFASRAETAAVALVYSPETPEEDESFYVYSPLVVNQEVTRPPEPGVRIEPWTLTVDRSEIRSVRLADAISGGARVWTTAMWGTNRDLRLLTNAEKRCGTLADFVTSRHLRIGEGLQLRERGGEAVDPVQEVAGKIELDMKALKNVGRIHVFPPHSLQRRVPAMRAFVRDGRSTPIEVCRPPHVIVNASRTFAVYSEEFIVVPARQVGIAGDPGQEDVLRALALYLSSDFVDYHRFLDSSQVAVRGVSTLASLKRLPTPLSHLSDSALSRWAKLHREIVAHVSKPSSGSEILAVQGEDPALARLEHRLNELVADALSLSEAERWLVHDLVHVRMKLADGQIGPEAALPPTDAMLGEYATALQGELDAFLDSPEHSHQVNVVTGPGGSAVAVALVPRRKVQTPRVVPAAATEAHAMMRARERIESTRSQWLYFDRNLVVYQDDSTVILKPSQRVWWTRSQALADADELISDALTNGGGG